MLQALRPFQLQFLWRCAAMNGRVLLADEMGLGKTVQGIAAACMYRR